MESPDAPDSTRPTDVIDDVFRTLASERRRAVLYFFHRSADEVASVEDLVDHVAGRGDDPENVAVGLHHVTLPKLGDAGVVEYDARSRTVRYREDPLVETMLEVARRIEDADLA